ncbi:MAG: alpha/beta hydrolase [Candidatus Coatesbacteria bacterium]|nr:alpha/beta hydrolase [Candidatus Coatesbacteria bacterium]
MADQTQNSRKKSAIGPATVAVIAIAVLAITVVVVVYSIDWEARLDKSLAKAVMTDTGAPTKSPKDVGLEFADAVITTEDGVHLAGWFIPSEKSKVTIVFCRGAAGNIGLWLDMIKRLHDLNYNVLAFDYRGTGLSGGSASFLAVGKDIAAAVKHAKQNFGRAASRIGLLGVSVGAAVGINVAAELDAVDAMVADSPFTSFAEMVPKVIKEHAPQLAGKVKDDMEFTDEFDPIRNVSRISPKPLFIIANESDTLCPASMALSLYRAAGAPKSLWVAPGTEHIKAKDVFTTEYWSKIAEFFNFWLVGGRFTEFSVSSRVTALPEGGFEVKLRVSNSGSVVAEDVPVAVIAETEAGDLQRNIYFPKTKQLSFKVDTEPLGFRVMRFFHIEPKDDTWELLPG